MSNSVALDDSPAPASGLRVSLFGPPEFAYEGRTLSVPRRESRALLYRLAAHRQSVPRAELAFLFWPDSPESTARRNLSLLLGNSRRALPAPYLLVTTDEGLGLDWSACASDVIAFQEYLTGKAELEPAVHMVRGAFLAGFALPGHPEFEAWAEAERSALERMYLEALAGLVQDRASTGEYRAAIEYARRYLATDELAEEMYRCLIGLYGLVGERRAAVHAFEQCAEVLGRELHFEPSADTRSLYQAVLDGCASGELLSRLGIRPAGQADVTLHARPRQNLPTPLTPFIGRHAETVELRHLLTPAESQAGLVTLTGPGGAGKPVWPWRWHGG